MFNWKKRKINRIAEKQKEFGLKNVYDAFYKTRKVIESCETSEQLDSAHVMVDDYYVLYENTPLVRLLRQSISRKAIDMIDDVQK